MSDHEKQATDFLTKTNTTFKAEFLRHGKYFGEDKETRDIYQVTLARGDRSYTFTFGQSINDSGYKLYRKDGQLVRTLPAAYAVLASITKYEPGNFKDFCSEYGYDEDSRNAKRIYKAVCDEWMNIQRLFSDEEMIVLAKIN